MSNLGTFAGIHFREFGEKEKCIELAQRDGGILILTSAQACMVAGILFGWARTKKEKE